MPTYRDTTSWYENEASDSLPLISIPNIPKLSDLVG